MFVLEFCHFNELGVGSCCFESGHRFSFMNSFLCCV